MDNMTPTACLHSLTASQSAELRCTALSLRKLPTSPRRASSEGLSEMLGGAFNAFDEASKHFWSFSWPIPIRKSCPSESSALGLEYDTTKTYFARGCNPS